MLTVVKIDSKLTFDNHVKIISKKTNRLTKTDSNTTYENQNEKMFLFHRLTIVH